MTNSPLRGDTKCLLFSSRTRRQIPLHSWINFNLNRTESHGTVLTIVNTGPKVGSLVQALAFDRYSRSRMFYPFLNPDLKMSRKLIVSPTIS